MGKLKAAIETLGCRVNIYDSEAMSELFKKDGYDIVPFNEYADVYVINTCTVTNMGDKKSRQMISKAHKNNPDSVICVVGCYAQVAKDDIAKIENVDIILGSRNKNKVVEYSNKVMATGEKIFEVTEVLNNKDFEDLKISDFENHTRAFLKIQDGCNRFCSYCMIPYARGTIVSKDKDKVLCEIRDLKNHGFKEIILTGIHIASYGIDKIKVDNETKKIDGNFKPSDILIKKSEDDYDLIDLLEDIETMDGIKRVRIGSIEPMFFENSGIDRIKKLEKPCPHYHLSLQSGSNSVLKRMNRRYTREEYRDVVFKLRENIKDVSITTDIIVGFPGETEEEFNETYEFLKELKLTKTHIFKYSPRQGTKAAVMENQVHGTIKEERSKVLLKLSDDNERDFLTSMVGKTYLVLFEEFKEGFYIGHTENYILTKVESKEDLTGQIKKVKIKRESNLELIGELEG